MATDLIVITKQGKVRGKACEDYHGGKFYSFSGIPYAKAPIGQLRFKAPQPAEPYSGMLDGTKESPECPSLDIYFRFHIGREDNCLNLNIYTKKLPNENKQKKAVMVWIHGGGFLYGSNKTEHYGPQYLMTEDIVLVTINYRLGIFGFLCFEDQSLGIPGNAGLKDQVMALKWVQQNIHVFNGDCNNVTIFGESAGSASVHYLTLSQTTKGLFHKAIMQSGCGLNSWARGKPNAIDTAEVLGYNETNEKIIYDKLCKESTRRIVNAQCKVKDTFLANNIRPLGPVVEYPSEDAFLTEDPIEIMKGGKQHQIPIIIGYNSLEGIFFEGIKRISREHISIADFESDIPYELKLVRGSTKSKALADMIRKFYYGEEEVSNDNMIKRYTLLGDVQFVYGIQKTIQIQSETSSAPVYAYKITLDEELNFCKRLFQSKFFYTQIVILLFAKFSFSGFIKNLCNATINKLPKNQVDGVSHGDDLFYLFPNFFTPDIIKGSPEDQYIQRFVKLWTNFAKFGNPTPEIDKKFDNTIWKPVRKGTVDAYFVIDKDVKMMENADKERMELWQNIFNQYPS